MLTKLEKMTEADIQPHISDIERYGMVCLAREVFSDTRYGEGEDISYVLHLVNGVKRDGRNYDILNCQDKTINLEEGVTLTHFVIGKEGSMIGVGFDEEDEYVFYRVEADA